MQHLPSYPGCITDVRGILAGHCTHRTRPTGCSVVWAPSGAVASVDVRGAAPGTRETDLLEPSNLVEVVHAVLLTGGSAWGLDAAGGVMRWLEEQGCGLTVGERPGEIVPIVPGAVIFDLHVGDARLRPSAEDGWLACQAASSNSTAVEQGNVGAGAGATVGKIFGMDRAMKGGLGCASIKVGSIVVGAMVVVNALGDVRDLNGPELLAGALDAQGLKLADTSDAILSGATDMKTHVGRNTTIGVIATDAHLTKSQARRLAVAGHDGLARAISPVHTMSDGDTLFSLATGQAPDRDGISLTAISHIASEVVARACVNAVVRAQTLVLDEKKLLAAGDLIGRTGRF